MGFWDNIANIWSINYNDTSAGRTRKAIEDINNLDSKKQPKNWNSDNTTDLAKNKYAYNNIVKPEMKAAALENRLNNLKPHQNYESPEGSPFTMAANMELGEKPAPQYDVNGAVTNQKEIDLWERNKANKESAQATIDNAKSAQAARYNKKVNRLYSPYAEAMDEANAAKKKAGLPEENKLSLEDLGITLDENDQNIAETVDETTAAAAPEEQEISRPAEELIANAQYGDDLYSNYTDQGYFDQTAYIQDLMANSEEDYWKNFQKDILDKYYMDEPDEFDIYRLINRMSEEDYKNFVLNPAIYDALYANSYIIDDYGNRVLVGDLHDEGNWQRWRDWSNTLNLYDAATTGDWAGVSDIIGTGTDVSLNQIYNITGYDPITGNVNGGDDGISPYYNWGYPVQTADMEQVYGDFLPYYPDWSKEYPGKELSPTDAAIMAGSLADLIGYSMYGDVLDNGTTGASGYNSNQYGYDDNGYVDDFAMVAPEFASPYFDALSYYQRGQ